VAKTYCFFRLESRLSIDCNLLKTHNIAMTTSNTSSLKLEVRIEATPNPQTLMFKFSQKLLEEAFDCPTAQDAEKSPLAAKIFGFPWTQSVFLGQDFISVTKQDWVDWDVLAEPLANLIKEHIENGGELYVNVESQGDIDENDSPLIKDIKRLLNQEIRPVVAYDGGDVGFVRFDEGKLYLQFKGSCSGCPSKSVTLKEGIEVRVKEVFPQVQEVIGI
jgi:Fe-S cluster biogenesis protein NfuA